MTNIKCDPKSVALAESIIETYKPKSVEDMQNALKDIFGPMFEAMLKGEMDNHLGYDEHSHEYKESANRRNGFSMDAEQISNITDNVMEEAQFWQNRALKKFYLQYYQLVHGKVTKDV